MGRAFLHYDVFTGNPLLGNQLAVFTDGEGLAAEAMQRIAREMNFAETTFVLPSRWAGTDVRMRIFTPLVELPIAGHPTIGSTFALADTGTIAPGTARFIFELGVGPTPVDLQWQGDRLAFAWMTQPNPVFGPIVDRRDAVAAALGLTDDDLLDAPVQDVSCGVPYLLVPLRDRAAVDRAISDAAAFRRLQQAIGIDRPIFLFAIDGDAGSAAPHTIYSRMFAPGFGITEDPATGSASGPVGCFLVTHGLVPFADRTVVLSHQGVAMGRASQVHIEIAQRDGVISDVKVGGEAVLVARGELLV